MRIVQEDDDPLFLELEHLRLWKNEKARYDQLVENQSILVAEMLKDRGQRSLTLNNHKYTLVQAQRTKVNEDGLRKSLGARLFNTLTVRKLDTHKLEAAMQAGTVDPVVVAQHSEIAENRPSIRISEVSND